MCLVITAGQPIQVYLGLLPSHPTSAIKLHQACVVYHPSQEVTVRTITKLQVSCGTMSEPAPRTLYEKLFYEHVAVRKDNGAALLYIGEEPPVSLIWIAYVAMTLT